MHVKQLWNIACLGKRILYASEFQVSFDMKLQTYTLVSQLNSIINLVVFLYCHDPQAYLYRINDQYLRRWFQSDPRTQDERLVDYYKKVSLKYVLVL